ncbi:unnamed protein product [Pocillopora meandrina]|uniref:Chromo domain-containing protein n=1 Tax=Pocillopora meandrina TaxID=46732 RepID=A0AAU9WP92_9CNID|nr:unnamed protein product [Pocillopora meandrina]
MDFDCESDNTDDIYEVERILEAKKKDGRVIYKVRWEGYGSEEDSWEPSENLLTCQELVERYWVQRKESYKKRGRKPKRLKEVAGEDSDTDEGNRKDQNDDDVEMSTPPEKRRRGRPPKNRRLETDSGAGTEESEGIAAKRKRGRPAKDEEPFPQYGPSDYLLLDLDEIAPLGLTRQASKELALVSLRKKQEFSPVGDAILEIQGASDETSSNTKEERDEDSKANETSNVDPSTVYSEQDDFQVIEISSQSTDDERENLPQESEPAIEKEWIVISSQSDSESEQGNLQLELSRNTTKKKKEESNIRNTETETSLGKKERKTKVRESFSVENQSEAKKSDSDSSGDNFSPISFSIESRTKALQGEIDNVLPNLDDNEMVTGKDSDELAQETDVNSNEVKSSLLRPDVSSKLSLSKMRTLGKSMKVKNQVDERLRNPNDTKGSVDLSPSLDANGNSNKTDGVLSSETSQPLVRSSIDENKIEEARGTQRDTDILEISATRSSLDGDVSQLNNRVTMKRHVDMENRMKGKAKRTEGRPKSRREFKRPLLTDKPSAIHPNSNGAGGSAGVMTDSLGKKTDKQHIVASTTAADLLPRQNNTKSVALMDGDLIGAIIQDSGKDDESKNKPVTSKQDNIDGKTHNGTQGDGENGRILDSGMEDISEGEDDLSDFEFDLDDFSPHSFFNEVEEAIVSDRAPSPAAEPLILSWTALKQAIRDGDTMLVRRALAVPGFNPDTIDTASGMTLLMWAATCGKDDIVKLLLKKGAGVNTDQKRTGMTALMHAAEQGFPETVQILLECGAHINWQQPAGETALMRACKKGHEEVVGVLLKHGVDTKVQSNYEQTAIQIAVRNQYFEIQNLLSEHEKSMENTLQAALGKCLESAGTLRLPLVMPYRCIAPGEKDRETFLIKYNSNKAPPGTKVVLFCVKADFYGDEVCLSFCGDNGVRSILLNSSIQYPLVQGNRSVYPLSLDSELPSNELTVETHLIKSRLIVCVANVSPTNGDS